MKSLRLSKSKIAAILALPFILSGCISGASIKGMTVHSPYKAEIQHKKLQESIEIQSVTGGKQTNPLWTSEISDGNFMEALRQSLKNAGFGVTDAAPAKYLLVATLKKVDQPMFGFDMTVTTVIQYSLRELATNKIILDKEISAAHTSTVGDAFLGPVRLELANEGAARNNIGQLLSLLANLDPDKIAVSTK